LDIPPSYWSTWKKVSTLSAPTAWYPLKKLPPIKLTSFEEFIPDVFVRFISK
jgi:hypothetical protein